MAISDIINDFIQNWSKKEELYLKIGVASDINAVNFTFKFIPIDEKSVVETVRMKTIVDGGPEAFVIVPKEGTKVVVGFHSNTVGQCLVVQEAAQILINAEDKTINVEDELNINCDDIKVSTDSWLFNGGIHGGLIRIALLETKLNKLVDELDDYKSKFNTHIHSGVTTGGGTSGTPAGTPQAAFTQFDKDDFENLKIKH